MTREHAIKEREAFNAFCDGKEIEGRWANWKSLEPNPWINSGNDADFHPSFEHRVKPTPTMIPLGPEDVSPGSVFALEEWARGCHRGYYQVDQAQLWWDSVSPIGFSVLQIQGWLISRDQGKSWERCEKEQA